MSFTKTGRSLFAVNIRIACAWIACVTTLIWVPFYSTAQAAQHDLVELQSMLETRIRNVVRPFDSDAMVIVSLAESDAKTELPGTSLILNKRSIEGNSPVHLSKIDIRVLTKKKTIPDSILKLIEDVTKESGPRPRISVEALPAELITAESKASDRQPASDPNKDDKDAAKKEKKAEDPTLAKKGEESDTSGFSLLLYILSGAVVVLGAVTFINGLISRKLTKELFTRFEKEFKEAVTERAETRRPADFDANSPESARFSAHSRAHSEKASHISAMPSESFSALFTDCYWSNADRYAAFIWEQSTIAQKTGLVAAHSFIRDYASYLSDFDPEDLGYGDDPYYLAPLKIEHLSNPALTQIVKTKPFFLTQISKLRADALSLTASERIDLQRSMPNAQSITDKTPPDFTKIQPSVTRQLTRKTVVMIQSIEEEKQLLSRKDLAIEDQEKILSLGWLTFISQDLVREWLKTFSAQDLASAWIGPSEVLEKLAACLPPKKRELVEYYLKTTNPSRMSKPFRRLHSLGIEHLKVQTRDEKAEKVA